MPGALRDPLWLACPAIVWMRFQPDWRSRFPETEIGPVEAVDLRLPRLIPGHGLAMAVRTFMADVMNTV
jgi:hypothetical protein